MAEPKLDTIAFFYNDGGEVVRESFDMIPADGGRSESKRPRQSNDCTAVALALATGVSYDAAYDYLKNERGRKCNRGANFPSNRKNDSAFGYDFIWESYPAIKGQRRMNIASFCATHPTGTYIARVSKHVFLVRDGIVYDAYQDYGSNNRILEPRRCVYGSWKVVKKS